MESLRYKPLNSDIQEIRLLRILPQSTDSSPTQWALSTVSLQNAPDFAALSYVWGDPQVRKDIYVDATKISVTENLANAMTYIQQHWMGKFPTRHPSELRIWIDAVSINQEDLDEKARQIPLMSTIYRQAEIIFAWLGSGDREVHDGIWTARRIARELKAQRKEQWPPLEWLKEYPSLCTSRPNTGEAPDTRHAWDCVDKLLDLTYWKRVWIFQEIVLGESILLLYGLHYMRYTELKRVCEWRSNVQSQAISEELPRPSFMSPQLWFDMITLGGPTERIENIESAKHALKRKTRNWNLLTSDLLAAEPRDNVYGFLGVLGGDLEHKIVPDYKKPVAEVYCEVMKLWIEETQSLKDVLESPKVWYTQNELGLPSWMPKFHLAEDTPYEPFTSKSRSASEKLFEGHAGKLAVHDSTLTAFGIESSQVIAVHEIVSDAPDAEVLDDDKLFHFSVAYLQKVDVYLTGIPPLQAIFEVLIAGQQKLSLQLAHLFIVRLTGLSEAKLQRLGMLPGASYVEFLRTKVFTTGNPNEELQLSESESESGSELELNTEEILEIHLHKLGRDFCFIETSAGHLGLGSISTQPGDSVVILKSCRVPFITRSINANVKMIGHSYIQGLMNGEIQEVADSKQSWIREFHVI